MRGRHSEAAFETVIEAHLLDNSFVPVAREGFDRERAIFPETVFAFIRDDSAERPGQAITNEHSADAFCRTRARPSRRVLP